MWRTGRKLGRTIYAQHGPAPSDDDVLLGMMDTALLASAVVDDHNRRLERGMIYICGLLFNETDPAKMQAIPSDGQYHAVRFGYADSVSEEQTDDWEMHSPDNHPDGHVVSDWRVDDYSGLIYPKVAGQGFLFAKLNWDGGDIITRPQYCRDPLGLTPAGPDVTDTTEWHSELTDKAWSIHVSPDTPIAVRVRNLQGTTRRIEHAQFKLIIFSEDMIARPIA